HNEDMNSTAGTTLGKLALKHGHDPYFLAAVMSSVTKDNLHPMMLSVLTDKIKSAATAPLVQALLEIAHRQGNTTAVATLLDAITAPGKGGNYAAWQFTALAGLLDSLDANNSSLTKLHAKGDQKVKGAIDGLCALYSTAQLLVIDPEASE